MESTELENNNVQNEETSSSSIPQIQKVGESSQSKKGIKKRISWFFFSNVEV